ncbi:MAG: dihydropteroate synthase [Bacteroidetes bacterium]|jgi:dihydropteroate synthase|nr:dihydropteroate synthase [Bacteroidota bacterium]
MHLYQDSMNIKGTLFDLTTPKVMGILNATDDSFYDGGKFVHKDGALEHAAHMLEQGADIIDVGGASSRPGATAVPKNLEQDRVLPIIEAISKAFPQAMMSIDTNCAETAALSIKAGAHIVNDISAGDDDPNMLETVSLLKVPYIAMHKQGTPKTMQNNPHYANVVSDIAKYFLQKLEEFKRHSILDVVFDPGFGFGKSVAHNYALLKNLHTLKVLVNAPVLVGVSRKSMINKVLQVRPEDALNGTTVLHAWALQNGANILRVHDVLEAKQAVLLFNTYKNA